MDLCKLLCDVVLMKTFKAISQNFRILYFQTEFIATYGVLWKQNSISKVEF